MDLVPRARPRLKSGTPHSLPEKKRIGEVRCQEFFFRVWFSASTGATPKAPLQPMGVVLSVTLPPLFIMEMFVSASIYDLNAYINKIPKYDINNNVILIM